MKEPFQLKKLKSSVRKAQNYWNFPELIYYLKKRYRINNKEFKTNCEAT